MTSPYRSCRRALAVAVLTAAALSTSLPANAAEPPDTTPPTVAYIGPSEVNLNGIIVELDDVNSDAANTEVHVFRDSVEVTSYQRQAPNENQLNSNIILMNFTTTVPDGNYEVHVKPRDKVGNIGPEVVGVAQKGQQIAQLNAYGAFQGGAEAAAGDVDGDGVDEVITAAGSGGGPHVQVFAVDFVAHTTTLAAGWMAYAPEFRGGVRVASADIDGDGTDEVITAPGSGGGPHVRAWHVNENGTVTEVGGFMAYDPNFINGVFVSGGDIDGAQPVRDEIVVGAGAGGGPHVRAFTRQNGTFTEACGFMAYDPNFTGGVRVALLDVTEDGANDIATAAGPGGGPHVQVFNAKAGCAPPPRLSSFMAYDPQFRGGVFISGLRAASRHLLVAAGPGGGPHVRLLTLAGSSADPINELAGFMAYDPNFTGGVTAAGGDFDGDGDPDIATTPGPGMPVTSIMRRWK